MSEGKVKIITINIYIATISIFIPFQNIFNAKTEKYKLDKKKILIIKRNDSVDKEIINSLKIIEKYCE